jgi:hypothetical protein
VREALAEYEPRGEEVISGLQVVSGMVKYQVVTRLHLVRRNRVCKQLGGGVKLGVLGRNLT